MGVENNAEKNASPLGNDPRGLNLTTNLYEVKQKQLYRT